MNAPKEQPRDSMPPAEVRAAISKAFGDAIRATAKAAEKLQPSSRPPASNTRRTPSSPPSIADRVNAALKGEDLPEE